MPKYNTTVMYERPDGTVDEEVSVIEANDIDQACDIAEKAVSTKGKFFFSDVREI